MGKNVTIQDLANALKMSRNTVSKALNGKHVPLKTRNAVIAAAIEMGYKGYQLSAEMSDASKEQKSFVLISSKSLISMNYYVMVLRGIEESLANYGIELIQFCVKNSTSFMKLKDYLVTHKIDGIICIEFFNPVYIRELVSLKIQMVCVDFPVSTLQIDGYYDIVLPESHHAVASYCNQLIQEKKCKTFGFVGDYKHCLSFYERFSGMREALFMSGILFDMSYSIVHEDEQTYGVEILQKSLEKLPKLPDCFVAANDEIAVNLLMALKNRNVQIPQEVILVGFGNGQEVKKFSSSISTFHVNKSQLGRYIVSLLLDRINHPTRNNYTVHVGTKLIAR